MLIITKVAFFAQYKPGDCQTSASARSSKAKTSNSLNSRKSHSVPRNSCKKSGRIVRLGHLQWPCIYLFLIAPKDWGEPSSKGLRWRSWDCSAIKVGAGLTFWGQSVGNQTIHHQSPWKKCRNIILEEKSWHMLDFLIAAFCSLKMIYDKSNCFCSQPEMSQDFGRNLTSGTGPSNQTAS